MRLQTPSVAQTAPPAAGTPAAPATSAQMLEASRAVVRELRNQLERAEDQRQEIQRAMNEDGISAADRTGLEARLKDTDARIVSLDQQIAAADARVAQAAAVPGATTPPPRPIVQRTGPPEEAWVLGGMFIFFVMMPVAVAYARRIWKRGTVSTVEMPAELSDRLNRLEQAVDAVAVELERVGEGQRYVTKVFSEQQRALGAGAAQPLEVRQREGVQHGRP